MKIAVIGKMRSGKNTFADFFINRGLQEFKKILPRRMGERKAKTSLPRHRAVFKKL